MGCQLYFNKGDFKKYMSKTDVTERSRGIKFQTEKYPSYVRREWVLFLTLEWFALPAYKQGGSIVGKRNPRAFISHVGYSDILESREEPNV